MESKKDCVRLYRQNILHVCNGKTTIINTQRLTRRILLEKYISPRIKVVPRAGLSSQWADRSIILVVYMLPYNVAHIMLLYKKKLHFKLLDCNPIYKTWKTCLEPVDFSDPKLSIVAEVDRVSRTRS